MSLTAQQLADFIAASPVVHNDHTILYWAQAGSVPDVRAALYDGSLWGEAYTLPQEQVSSGEIWTTLMNLPAWPNVAESVKNDITRVVTDNPFPIGIPAYASAVQSAITSAYPTLLEAWENLKTRVVSYGEKHAVTDDLISAAIGLLAG